MNKQIKRSYQNEIFQKRIYDDNNKDLWFIYKHKELVNGWPSVGFYVQKVGCGDIIYAFGCDPEDYDTEIEISVNNFIESIKDETRFK